MHSLASKHALIGPCEPSATEADNNNYMARRASTGSVALATEHVPGLANDDGEAKRLTSREYDSKLAQLQFKLTATERKLEVAHLS